MVAGDAANVGAARSCQAENADPGTMPALRHSPSDLFALLLLAACAGGPSSAPGTDRFADRKFPALTAEALQANALPEGYRLGDPAPVAPSTPDQPAGPPPWRSSRDPNPDTLFVAARGSAGRVDYVQWVFESSHRPALDLIMGAGIQLGEVVALGRARPRNWARLSQGHARDERVEVFVQGTDRPDFYVQRIGYDGALDSLVWSKSMAALLADDERFDYTIARDQLTAAMAARDEATVAKYRYWLRGVTEPGPKALVEAAEARLVAWAKEHDEPLLAQLEALRARHQAAWRDANDDARVRLWAADRDQALELWRRLKRAKSGVPEAIDAAWQEFVRERCGATGGASPESAVGCFWRYVLAAPRRPADVVDAWVRVQELDNPESSYFQTVDLRARLAAGDAPLLPPTRAIDELVRPLLARQLRREAAADRSSGHALRADWIEQGVLLALERLEVPPGQRYPFVSGAEYWKLWNDVTRYERLVADRARIGLRVQAVNTMAQEEAKAGAERRQRTGFDLQFMTAFLARQREALAAELRGEAEAAAARGHFATATVHALQADDVLLQSPATVQSLEAVPRTGSVLHYARQFLAQVLPPIDSGTAQGLRLCELLAEGEAAEWPLVRDLAIRIEPDDVPQLRAQLGLVPQFAHLVRAEGDTLALVAKAEPSDPATDERFWAAWAGRSQALLDESAWLSGEGAWIRPEGEWIGAEKAAIEVELARLQQEVTELDREFTAHQRLRANVNAYDESAVRAYNATSTTLEQRKTEYNRKAEANRARVDAFNARVKTHGERVAVYNRRLAAYNEQRMREDAAGQVALDAKLRPALLAALRDALQRWEEGVRARSADSSLLDMELRFGKALFGQHEARPELWTRPLSKGYARIVADSTLRAAPRQSTNLEYARLVVQWWRWAVLAEVPEREATLDQQFDEFVAHRDLEEMKAAILTAADAAHRDFLLRRLEERRRRFFASR